MIFWQWLKFYTGKGGSDTEGEINSDDDQQISERELALMKAEALATLAKPKDKSSKKEKKKKKFGFF